MVFQCTLGQPVTFQWHSSVHWTSECTLAQGKGPFNLESGYSAHQLLMWFLSFSLRKSTFRSITAPGHRYHFKSQTGVYIFWRHEYTSLQLTIVTSHWRIVPRGWYGYFVIIGITALRKLWNTRLWWQVLSQFHYKRICRAVNNGFDQIPAAAAWKLCTVLTLNLFWQSDRWEAGIISTNLYIVLKSSLWHSGDRQILSFFV